MYFKKQKNTRIPQQIIAFDTETQGGNPTLDKPAIQTLVLGTMIHRRYYRDRKGDERYIDTDYTFMDVGSFWSYLYAIANKRKSHLNVYCHNGNFDYAILDIFNGPKEVGLEIDYQIIGAPPIIIRLTGAQSKITLLDTLNYFRVPLKVLATSLGLPMKGIMPHSTDLEALTEYCLLDTRITLGAIHQWREFVRDNDLGVFASTLAGQSLNAYKHKYMPNLKIAKSRNIDTVALERQSYLGGRTECFYIGRIEGTVTCLDINSMYPYVMTTEEYPHLHFKTFTGDSCYNFIEAYYDKLGWVKATIQILEPSLPIRHNDRLCFPVGEITGVWASPEYIAHADKFIELKLHAIGLYHKADIFTDYVEGLYELRKAFMAGGEVGYAYHTKILLNSLYGKFGQKVASWQDAGPTDEPDGSSGFTNDTPAKALVQYKVVNGRIMLRGNDSEHSNSIPVIASHVTSNARLLLAQYIRQAGSQNVYYCDTDSLFVNNRGLERLEAHIDPTTLGKLKVEWQSDNVVIKGAKHYRVDGRLKAKGIKAAAVEVSPDTYEQLQFRGLEYHAKLHQYGRVDVNLVSRHNTGIYHKGVVEADGWVSPLELYPHA